MDPVVHFEMPFENRERAANFYSNVFSWQMRPLGEEMGNYVLATTIETDTNGPTRPGAINGGLYPKDAAVPSQYPSPSKYPSLVISVDDINEAMKKVTAAGGEILGEPMDIPGVGQYVSFYDTEGNRVSMLQAIQNNWHAPQ